MRPLALTLVVSLAVPALAHAQGAPFGPALRASAALELAAEHAAALEPAHPPVAEEALAPRRRGRKSEGTTLMIVGGAAIVVGAIAGGGGGTVLIVGGLVCAGYGFYLYTE